MRSGRGSEMPTPGAQVVPLAPVERRTLNEQSYDRLKKALLSGRFTPGQVLTLRTLADSLGTSVMPVRDAVSRLAAEQAFELLPNRRIRIPSLAPEESDEVWDLRILLEGQAASRAAKQIADSEVEEIARLRDEVRMLADRGELHAMLDRNDTLQFAVYRAARSPVQLRLIETLRMQTAPECTAAIEKILSERPPFYEETLGYHDQLVDSLARRDAAAAQRVRRQDLRSMRDWVRRSKQ